jgi:hypothetical protein
MTIIINEDNLDNMDSFKEILKKDESTIINEALEVYFQAQQKILLEKNLDNENAMTNLSYDEFWDDIEV